MKKQLFLFVLFFSSVDAFKLDRVILATDANPDYIEFWPVVAKAWQEIVGIRPTLALIAHADVPIDDSLGDVIRFEPIEGIPTSFQAQVIRLLLPTLFPDEVSIISDIDMIPLNRSYFVRSVAGCPSDSFVIYRDGAYDPSEQKYPMCYFAAKGTTFSEVFDVQDMAGIRSKLIDLHSLNLGWNTDELVLYGYLNTWSAFSTRCIRLGHGVGGRVDRLCWEYDVRMLRSGQYIDAHCPRPYSAYKDSIDGLVHRPEGRLSNIMINAYNRYFLNARYPLGDFEETGESNIIRTLLRDGDVVFDVGANCGEWTEVVLKNVQPKKVYAFEPVSHIAELYREKFSSDSVELFECALSDTDGEKPFFYYPYCKGVAEDGTLSSLYRRERVENLFETQGLERSVKTISLDTFCAEHAIDHIDFIKIDTEGAEYDVLQGATALLLDRKIDFIQFEYGRTYIDSNRTLKEVYEFLTSLGYIVFKIHQNGIIHVKRWQGTFENYYQSNYLAVSPALLEGSVEFEILMNVNELPRRTLDQGDAGTHMAMLLTAVAHTNGPILEMGAGDCSTPLLHAVCSPTRRSIWTADTDKNILLYFIDLQNEWHLFSHVPVFDNDWDLNPKPEIWDELGGDVDWSVVLINHRPGERRVKDIERLRERTQIFVVHDTQEPGYGYEEILNSFKYKYVDERYATETTLVSDTIDVSQFFK